ncbi:hypothetical protein ABT024_17945 [Streptomyces sp. NPDC002812]|uniref:hypothetical protein n=1 Tax=Streptomyces sp. NPDC002812 TaxID=3154434 RepID=UPI00331B4E63
MIPPKRCLSLVQSLIKEVGERADRKLREVVAADRKAFGPVSAEARRQAEQEW